MIALRNMVSYAYYGLHYASNGDISPVVYVNGEVYCKVSWGDYDTCKADVLEKVMDEYAEKHYPPFWKSPLKWLGLK